MTQTSALTNPPAPHLPDVATAWDAAAPRERATLLERLLEPLGPLARAAVASGAFAVYLAREHWGPVHVRLDDAMDVQADQVLDLARFALQVQPDVLQGLVGNNPAEACSAIGLVGLAATLLVAAWRR